MRLHTLRSTHRIWMAWTAALAVLLGALAPTVSRWLHSDAGLPVALMEICVTREGGPSTIVLKAVGPLAGLKTAGISPSGTQVGAADASTDSMPQGHLDHCPFCVMHGDGHGMAPPVSTASLPLMPRTGDHLPALFLQAPRPLHAWAPSLARAPPTLFA